MPNHPMTKDESVELLPSREARELLAIECEANGGDQSAAALRHDEKPEFFIPSCCALRAIDRALSRPSPTPLEDVVERLRAALLEYGAHKPGCRAHVALGQKCYCGWRETTQALARLSPSTLMGGVSG